MELSLGYCDPPANSVGEGVSQIARICAGSGIRLEAHADKRRFKPFDQINESRTWMVSCAIPAD